MELWRGDIDTTPSTTRTMGLEATTCRLHHWHLSSTLNHAKPSCFAERQNLPETKFIPSAFFLSTTRPKDSAMQHYA
jgi:hypothetical protein